ncbi:MAG: hypothetical protein ABW252_19545 [Polyangiales bacterium]
MPADPVDGAEAAGDVAAADEAPTPLAQQAGGAGWCAVKAIVDKSCTGCHDGNGTGGSPMGLTEPADFKAAAPISAGKTVGQAVSARTHDTGRPMPPRGLLPAADLKVLDDWIKAGSPAPAAACAETGGATEEAWPPPECDEVYELRAHGTTATSPYMVPAGGEFHPQITLDPPWLGQQVQAIGWHPLTDNAKVLHHWILYNGLAFLTGWAPGDEARPPFPSDVGMDMPNTRGSLRLDMHYFNTAGSKQEPDRSGLAVCVVKGAHMRRNHAAVTMGFTSFGPVLAPAMAKGYNSTGTCNVRVTQPVHLLTAAPHAHKLAVHMKFTVKKRSGQMIVMHDQPFKFGEQGTYGLSPEVMLETGDVVTTTCTFDNPTLRSVTFGESTNNEMCFNFAMYYPKGALSCGLGLL